MSVIQFPKTVRPTTYCATELDNAHVRKRAITSAIEDIFYYATNEIRKRAIDHAFECIEDGSSFAEAIDAAELVIKASDVRPYRPATESQRRKVEQARNALRLAHFNDVKRVQDIEKKITSTTDVIRSNMRGQQQPEIEAAIRRARIVLEGNGSIPSALHAALRVGDHI